MRQIRGNKGFRFIQTENCPLADMDLGQESKLEKHLVIYLDNECKNYYLCETTQYEKILTSWRKFLLGVHNGRHVPVSVAEHAGSIDKSQIDIVVAESSQENLERISSVLKDWTELSKSYSQVRLRSKKVTMYEARDRVTGFKRFCSSENGKLNQALIISNVKDSIIGTACSSALTRGHPNRQTISEDLMHMSTRFYHSYGTVVLEPIAEFDDTKEASLAVRRRNSEYIKQWIKDNYSLPVTP